MTRLLGEIRIVVFDDVTDTDDIGSLLDNEILYFCNGNMLRSTV